MNVPAILKTFAAQDTAKALIVLGRPIQPQRDDCYAWWIGNLIWTVADLMTLTARQGVQPANEQVH